MSETLRPMGPARSCVAPRGMMPERLTRPCVATMPARLQNAVGPRTEPPVSVPIPAAANHAAIETPTPLLEPPGWCARL